MGLIGAFAFMFPAQQIFVFGLLPVPAKFFFIFAALFSLFFILVPTSGIAHDAHLGGLLAGWAFVRFVLERGLEIPSINFRMPKISARKEVVRTVPAGPFSKQVRQGAQGDLPPEEFISKEVDPILDKISAHGIQSLTERERRILEAARSRMAKR
jgi:hypothetical protein